MTTTSEVASKVDNILCKRGLAKSGTIVSAAQESPELYGYSFGEIDAAVLETLRNDDTAIREAFNSRHGAIELTDASARVSELSARTELIDILIRLHRVGHRLNQGLERRAISTADVITVMATLTRLSRDEAFTVLASRTANRPPVYRCPCLRARVIPSLMLMHDWH